MMMRVCWSTAMIFCYSERIFAVRAVTALKTGVILHVSSGIVAANQQPYYHEVVALLSTQ